MATTAQKAPQANMVPESVRLFTKSGRAVKFVQGLWRWQRSTRHPHTVAPAEFVRGLSVQINSFQCYCLLLCYLYAFFLSKAGQTEEMISETAEHVRLDIESRFYMRLYAL